MLALFNTFTGSRTVLDIPPNQVTTTESFVTLSENARIENFQAHMHLRGKGMSMEALYPDGRREMLSQVTDFNFNWHNMYIYADDVAPLLPKGTILHLHRVVRQHARQQIEPRSGSVGRLGRPHHRRDGPRLAEHHLFRRRRVQGRSGRAHARTPEATTAAASPSQR